MNFREVVPMAICAALALLLTYAGTFLVPKELSVGVFDRRAIQHMFGFWGLALLLLSFVVSFYSWAAYKFHALFLGGIALIAWTVPFVQDKIALSNEVLIVARLIQHPGTVYLVAVLSFTALLRTERRRLVIVLGAVFCFVVSLYWELIQQPLSDVYDGPARYAVQASQVIVDTVGIVLAFTTYWGVTLLSTGRAKSARP